MKYGIISDIHGNLEALNAVLDDAADKGVEKYLCLGDIVGYGANPKECIKKIISINAECVVGNHDHAVVGLTDTVYFNTNAKMAVTWTEQILSEKEKKFLADLPFVRKVDDITLVHSSLESPEMWRYVLNDVDAEKNLKRLENRICFIGHSHMPCIFQEQYNSRALFDFLNRITIKEKSIVNVGSVGQPRDGDPRASYVIYDSETMIVSFERVPYNIKAAQKKIIKAGLPKILAARLDMGR